MLVDENITGESQQNLSNKMSGGVVGKVGWKCESLVQVPEKSNFWERSKKKEKKGKSDSRPQSGREDPRARRILSH